MDPICSWQLLILRKEIAWGHPTIDQMYSRDLRVMIDPEKFATAGNICRAWGV